MIKTIVIGNLTKDVELKLDKEGKPYTILRIASDRRYHASNGSKLTDFISAKVRGQQAENCAAYLSKGSKVAVEGDFETITFPDDPTRQPGFLIKATDVLFLSPKKAEETGAAMDAAVEDDSADGDSGDLAEAA